jgi:hypothetical protein
MLADMGMIVNNPYIIHTIGRSLLQSLSKPSATSKLNEDEQFLYTTQLLYFGISAHNLLIKSHTLGCHVNIFNQNLLDYFFPSLVKLLTVTNNQNASHSLNILEIGEFSKILQSDPLATRVKKK